MLAFLLFCAVLASVPFDENQLAALRQVLDQGRITEHVPVDASSCPTVFTGAERVVCDDEGFLTHLNLRSIGMRGFLPYRVGVFTRLIYLDLRRNALTGPVNTFIKALVNLQFFDISSNHMTGDIADIVQYMPLLQVCILVDPGPEPQTNCFEGSLPERLRVCSTGKRGLCDPVMERHSPLIAPTTKNAKTTTTKSASTASTTKKSTTETKTGSKVTSPSSVPASTQDRLHEQESHGSILERGSDSPEDHAEQINFLMMIVFSVVLVCVCVVATGLLVFVYRKRSMEQDVNVERTIVEFNDRIEPLSERSYVPAVMGGTLPTRETTQSEYDVIPITSTLRQRPVYNGVVYDKAPPPLLLPEENGYGRPPPTLDDFNESSSASTSVDYVKKATQLVFGPPNQEQYDDEEQEF